MGGSLTYLKHLNFRCSFSPSVHEHNRIGTVIKSPETHFSLDCHWVSRWKLGLQLVSGDLNPVIQMKLCAGVEVSPELSMLYMCPSVPLILCTTEQNVWQHRAGSVAAQSRKGGSINTPMFKAWNWELWATVNLLECCLTHNMSCMCLNSTCDFCCVLTLTLHPAHHSRKFLRRGDVVHHYHTSRATAIFITLLHLLEKSFMTRGLLTGHS